jgi:hypothetical protein
VANFIQNIQGIRIIPSNALKTSGLFDGPVRWPRGYAFGGWVYNSTLRLGFSKQPTELVLSIVLEASAKHKHQSGHGLAPGKFDISKNLLRNSLTAHDARNYAAEDTLGHFYYIDLHGVRLKRMYLHDYSISVEANQKVLNVTLKDYSLILNKIYIGLIKRQGPAKGMVALPNKDIQFGDMQEAIASITIEGFCPNCYLLGRENLGGPWGSNVNNFFNIEKGKIWRKLTLGSYAVQYSSAGGKGSSSLRRWDSQNPRILADQACYNSRVFDSPAACAGVYATYINMNVWASEESHQHPLRRMGRAWQPRDQHYCDAAASCTVKTCGDDSDEACPDGAACTNAGGRWEVHQTDKTSCEADGHQWINDANLMPKEYWSDLTTRTKAGERSSKGYTIDGGYLMLGTEMFSDSPCSDLPDINYNFTELLDSLIFNGLQISTRTDVGLAGISHDVDKNPKFRANYIGTLREVLEQWSSAMGLDFYWDNTRQKFSFIDLEQGADLRPIQNIPDPATPEGREFGGTQDGKSVIVSYKESSSLANTHIQRVITSNTKPYTKREKSKDIQRYTPMLPLHPLDFTAPNKSITNYTSAYGEAFNSYRYANILPWTPRLTHGAAGRRPWAEPNIPFGHEARKRIWYTNRQLWDIDYAMALSKYNRSLREMYVGQRIVETCKSTRLGIKYDSQGAVLGHNAGVIHPEIHKDFMGNCMALGFIPIAEIIHPETKSILIGHHMQGDSDDVQDINKDQTFYKLFIGYYTKEEHEDIVGWEQRGAEAMYKNGAVIQGTLPGYPYIPRDFHGLKAGERGFDPAGEGLSIPKLQHSFSPSADTYAQCPTCLEMHDAPFNGVLIRSGNFLPTGLRFAQLDNPWGTNVEGFEIDFNRTFNDNACVKYNSSLNIAEDMSDMYEYKTQTWDLDAFTPKFFDDLSESWVDMDDVFTRLYDNNALIDEVTVASLDINTKFRRTCKKIHLMIVTDVANHENVRFDVRSTPGLVNQMSRKALELWQIKERQRKAREEYRDKCDVDIHYEFCENAITDNANAQAQYGNAFGANQLMACAISPTGVYKEGFARNLVGGFPVSTPYGVIAHPGHVNSRGLNIRLTRNPDRNTKYPRTDDLGYYYLADLEDDLQTLPTKTFNYTIVYPINNYKMYGVYGWAPGVEPFTEPVPYNNMDPTLLLNGFTFWTPLQSSLYPGGIGNHTLGLGNFQTYNGIWNAKVTIEDRIPEITEIYGEPMNTGPLKGNPTTSIKVINNTIDPDLSAMLDPQSNEFVTKIYDAHGDEIKTIEEWHKYIANGIPGGRGLNNYDVREPTSQIDFKLAGSVKEFPNFIAKGYAHPRHGLTSYNVSLTEAGLQTDMTFASRPPVAPELEAILNKIGPRIM